jgi:hypothetical protein
MIKQEDSVIACWMIKNITGFLCFSYLSYVVLVQFGRGNKLNLSQSRPKQLKPDEDEFDDTETVNTSEIESIVRKKQEYKNLQGGQVSSPSWLVQKDQLKQEFEASQKQAMRERANKILFEYTFEQPLPQTCKSMRLDRQKVK